MSDGRDLACDECGRTPGVVRIDATVGLALAMWNLIHPERPRDELWFCTEECLTACGLRLGNLAREKARDA